jgi:hypothetical protein
VGLIDMFDDIEGHKAESPEPAEEAVPLPLDLTREDHRQEALPPEAEVVRLACFVFESYGDEAASPEIQADLAEVATLYRKDPGRWSQYWGERARACGNT